MRRSGRGGAEADDAASVGAEPLRPRSRVDRRLGGRRAECPALPRPALVTNGPDPAMTAENTPSTPHGSAAETDTVENAAATPH